MMSVDDTDQLIRVVSSISTLMNSFLKYRRTQALQDAARFDGVDRCRRLVSQGANINVKCEETGFTLMHWAALNKTHGLELIAYFASLGLKVDATGKYLRMMPIYYALLVKNFEVAKELLTRFPPGHQLGSNTFLHFCVKAKNLEGVKILFKNEDANGDKFLLCRFCKAGSNAFHVAAIFADVEMCAWLLSQGADPRELAEDDMRKPNALHLAAAYNKRNGRELVRFFISRLGFDVNGGDKYGFTPLHYALMYDNLAVAEDLLVLGADLNVRNPLNMENLMLCCVSHNKLESAKLLHAKNQTLVQEYDASGKNSLHLAASFADLEMCKWLVYTCGVDVYEVCTDEEESFVQYTAYNVYHGKDILAYFVPRFGLDLNMRDKSGLTPLHYALIEENIPVAEELVRLGADLQVKFGAENLYRFCERNRSFESVKFLIEKQPDLLK